MSTNEPTIEQLIRWHVPLTKSYVTTERGEKQHIMEGIASNEARDAQEEVVVQQGMDFAPLLRSGIVNWDHLPGPENIIGEPLHGEIRHGANGPEFFLRSLIYVEEKPRAREAWATAEAMKKAGNRRQLGWSVEGSTLRRTGSHIVRSEVRHVALTHQPVNETTWATIAKSMALAANGATVSTLAAAEPVMLENLDRKITSVLWGDCGPDRACYAPNGFFYGGRLGAHEHLVKCKGMDPTSAASLIKRLIDSGI